MREKRLADLLEPELGGGAPLALVAVRVVLPRKSPVCLLEIRGVGAARDAENLVCVA